MKLSTNGLIIRESHVGENDRLVTVLTRDRGLMRAFVPGGRSIKGKKHAATALLTYGNFVFSQGKDSFRITEAECVEVFFGLRNDLEKLTLAQYFCELCGCIVPEEVDAGIYLRLMLNSLKFLEQSKLPDLQLKAVVEIALLTLGGYMPQVEGCNQCDETVYPMYFDPIQGHILCEHHRSPNSLPVSTGVAQSIYHISHSTVDKLFSFTLSQGGINNLATVSEAFVLAQLERKFTTLDFYHSIRIK